MGSNAKCYKPYWFVPQNCILQPTRPSDLKLGRVVVWSWIVSWGATINLNAFWAISPELYVWKCVLYQLNSWPQAKEKLTITLHQSVLMNYKYRSITFCMHITNCCILCSLLCFSGCIYTVNQFRFFFTGIRSDLLESKQQKHKYEIGFFLPFGWSHFHMLF